MTRKPNKETKLKEVTELFFKLGCISFGGPAAHIAMMEDEVVAKRRWMTRQHFLDLIGATNLIPGPNSTEMTMHCGQERAGWKGLIAAGVSFILPAVVITMVLAWFYKNYGTLPEAEPFLYGVKPAVIAIILAAVVKLGKKALKTIELWVLGSLTLIATLIGLHEILALFLCGFLGIVWYMLKQEKEKTRSVAPFLALQAVVSASNLKILWIFLKVGALLYGSGYVLFAYLDAELVGRGLLTRQELMDAVAVGQFTPGPVLTTATFVGWQLNGFWGAVLATVGIFLPSFVFVALLNPWIPKMRSYPVIAVFLDAVNVAAVAVIAAVCIEMGKESLTDWRATVILVLSLTVVFVLKKLNSAFIVLGGGVFGYLLYLIHIPGLG